ISPASGTTGANGKVVFTYSAPANANGFPNQHLLEVLKANTTWDQTIVTDTQKASLLLFVENDNAPDWLTADVNASKLVPSTAVRAPMPPVTASVWIQPGVPAAGGAVIFQGAPGSVGMEAQFEWAHNYTSGAYGGKGLDLAYFDYGGSFGPSLQSSAGQGSGYGADNMLGDVELLDHPGIDSCDSTTWPANFPGYYLVNATGLTPAIQPAPN